MAKTKTTTIILNLLVVVVIVVVSVPSFAFITANFVYHRTIIQTNELTNEPHIKDMYELTRYETPHLGRGRGLGVLQYDGATVVTDLTSITQHSAI